MVLYIPVKQDLDNPEIGNYASFGVVAFRLGWCSCAKIAVVDDISVSFYETSSLAARCTLGQLDPVHLIDVVEDFICK